MTTVELRVADAAVGELRYRRAGGAATRLIAGWSRRCSALELERSRSPEWASDEAAGDFVGAVLAREVTDRGDIVARAAELGTDLDGGAGVVIAARRAARGADGRLAGAGADPRAARPALVGAGLARGQRRSARRGRGRARSSRPRTTSALERAAPALARELDAASAGFHLTVGRSRRAADPVDLYRAGKRRCWRPTSARPRAARCSPSRTPAPTGCCCRR